MIAHLLLPALLLGGVDAAALQDPTEAARATSDAYQELVAEFDAAVAHWTVTLDATEDRAARTELRRNHPVKAFWERFEALAAGGEGRATLWLAKRLKDNGTRASERGPILAGYYETLCTQHASADWFGEAVAALMQESKVDGALKMTLLRRTVENAKAPAVRAAASYGLGSLLYAEEASKAEGERLLRAVASEHPKTPWGTLARGMFITAADLDVGKPAPDFYGETIDGFGFSLSDYRGKVVLVDFYGFW